MMARRSAWVMLVLMVLVAPTAAAQGILGDPVVRTTGIATVESEPDYVEFWLRMTRTGSTFQEAARATDGIQERIIEACEVLELAPLEVKASAQAIATTEQTSVVRTIRLRFPARILGSTDESRQYFAWLCDTNRLLATELDCALEGPTLGVNERDKVEQSALTRAMESAYPLAQRAAEEMKSLITSVQESEVIEVTWNADPNWRGPQPEYGRVTCTVKVRMTYTLGSY